MSKKDDSYLRFVCGNAKLGKSIWTFSLPAGHTCPGASLCLARADMDTGKIKDGAKQQFRCYAASDESRYPSTRRSRWHNFTLLTQCGSKENMIKLIQDSLPDGAQTVRIHVSGDFFSQAYFDAWVDVCTSNPDIEFYAYTKSLHFVEKSDKPIPDNLTLTASMGGKYDHIAAEQKLPTAVVVSHPDEAKALKLEIDHDDSHARAGSGDFALLLHGVQPKESDAAEAVKKMKAEGVLFSYSKNKRPAAAEQVVESLEIAK